MHGSAIAAISQPFLYVWVQLNNTLHLTVLMAWQNLISRVAERAGAGGDWMSPCASGDHLQTSAHGGSRVQQHPHAQLQDCSCGKHSLGHTHTSSPSPPANIRALH